jgi:hypothetical protein
MDLYIAFFAFPFFAVAILATLYVAFFALADLMRAVADWIRGSWISWT